MRKLPRELASLGMLDLEMGFRHCWGWIPIVENGSMPCGASKINRNIFLFRFSRTEKRNNL